ncbi:hypothetical protein D3C80_1708380 [compost metagenome]
MSIVKLPAAVAQVGWVTALSVGTAGVDGCAFTTAATESDELQNPSVAFIV